MTNIFNIGIMEILIFLYVVEGYFEGETTRWYYRRAMLNICWENFKR